MTTSPRQATAQKTSEYFLNHQLHKEKLRGIDGLSLSALGAGTYLGDSNEAKDRSYETALLEVLKSGVSVIDTAVNYRCQRSERLIAYVLRKMSQFGLSREQVFLSTKGGFLAADGDPQSFKSHILSTYINTGLISPDDIVQGCHCMTPAYLESQIDLSLRNLKIDAVDLYYLHNPEAQLPVVGEGEFYRRLTLAFETFEKAVAEGKMVRYGLATWQGLRAAPGTENHLSLERVYQIAVDVGGDQHHFQAVQMPYNLAMLEAAVLATQSIGGEMMSPLQAAHVLGLTSFVSAPLMQSHVLQLPEELFTRGPADQTPAQKSLNFVLSTPGVTTALVGMSSLEHASENQQVLSQRNWTQEEWQSYVELLIQQTPPGS